MDVSQHTVALGTITLCQTYFHAIQLRRRRVGYGKDGFVDVWEHMGPAAVTGPWHEAEPARWIR